MLAATTNQTDTPKPRISLGYRPEKQPSARQKNPKLQPLSFSKGTRPPNPASPRLNNKTRNSHAPRLYKRLRPVTLL